MNTKTGTTGNFFTSFNNATTSGLFGTQIFKGNTLVAVAGTYMTGWDNQTGIISTAIPSVPTSLSSNKTQTNLPTTDTLLFTVPLTTSSGNTVHGVIVSKSSVAGTAVNLAFNVTAVGTNGGRGYCHTQAELTATSDTVGNLLLPTILTGRAKSTTHTDFITANTPQPINFECSIIVGSTATSLKIYMNPEVTGATISANTGSFYIKLP